MKNTNIKHYNNLKLTPVKKMYGSNNHTSVRFNDRAIQKIYIVNKYKKQKEILFIVF